MSKAINLQSAAMQYSMSRYVDILIVYDDCEAEAAVSRHVAMAS